ncbi:MAG: hypothetical protein A3E00_15100 [Curvibacter sp. RIFCSPHIGHO2_12_FULL_63_18]|nr:MAG: hypothetical protein A2037_04000 [Curvibacter sp. GWA2_63_95]OGP04115.1 MAG: hypothetical protein A3E00_15100 [Curvibacter sp. RIFCSPHIGHO2_12_FULL_63_18]
MGFDGGALGLGFKAALAGSVRRLSCFARLGRRGNAINQGMKPFKGIEPVKFLRAELLGLEHDDTLAGDAAVLQGQQPFFHVFWQ